MSESRVVPSGSFIERSADGTTLTFIIPDNVRIVDGIKPTFAADTPPFEAPNEPGSLRSMTVDDAVQVGQRLGHVIKDLLDIS